MEYLCECESSNCKRLVYLTDQQFLEKGLLILIVNGCPKGPEPTDTLVRECEGYSLYQEKQ